MIESRVDQLVEDARRAIQIHDGVLGLKAERDELRAIVRECWPFLFDDSGTPIAPEDLRQRIKDLGLSKT